MRTKRTAGIIVPITINQIRWSKKFIKTYNEECETATPLHYMDVIYMQDGQDQLTSCFCTYIHTVETTDRTKLQEIWKRY